MPSRQRRFLCVRECLVHSGVVLAALGAWAPTTATNAQNVTFSRWPVLAPRVTQAYGCLDCYAQAPNRFHAGIDMVPGTSTSCGAAVFPVATGTVVRVQRGCDNGGPGPVCGSPPLNCGRGYGNHVVLRHDSPGQTVYSLYAHLRQDGLQDLHTGDVVQPSDVIGLIGSSGLGAGCHLHLATFAIGMTAGEFNAPTECPATGLLDYQTSFPDGSCGLACRNPQTYFPIACRDFVGGLAIRDAPGGALLDATVAAPSQLYVALGNHSQSGSDWTMVTLPGVLGPTGSPQPAAQSTTHGWIAGSGSPRPCVPRQALSGSRVGSHGEGAYLFDRTTGVFDIGLVWSGDWVAPIQTDAADEFCDEPWVEVSVPSSRTTTGATTGWLCGEDLTPDLACVGAELGCGEPPSVSTLSATQVTQGSALLRMAVNPSGSSTFAWFEGGSGGIPVPSTTPVDAGSGVSNVAISSVVSGLACGSSYSFRATAENAGGLAVGASLPFSTQPCGGSGGQPTELLSNGGFESGTTGWDRGGSFRIGSQSCPYAGSQYAHLALADGAPGNNLIGTLERSISIPADATDVALSYRCSIATQETGSTPFDVLSVMLLNASGSTVLRLLETYSNADAIAGCGGSAYRLDTFDVSDLAGESIRLRFLGTTDSSAPTVFRIDNVSLVATTPSGGPPDVTTSSATEISSSSAFLNLTVQPNGRPTEVWFAWDDSQTLSYETQHISVGSSSGTVPISIPLTGLECDTTHWFRAFAENAEGDDQGITRSFVTSGCAGEAPVADTDPAENVTSGSATLTADITANGLPTEAWFEWGETSSLGISTPHTFVGSSNSPTNLEFNLLDLECETTYYFEAHAENAAGQDDGSTHSFETLDCGLPVPADDFVLYTNPLVGCSGANPAVLLGWTMPSGVDPTVTVENLDGSTSIAVDTTSAGPNVVVDAGLLAGSTYQFRGRGTRNGASIVSNVVTAHVMPAECDFPVGPGEVPHRNVLWAEPPYCVNGTPAVRLLWTDAVGAEIFDLERLQLPGGTALTVEGIAENEYLDVSARPGDALSYLVNARNSAGERGSYPFAVFIPSDVCEPPAVPSPFEAIATSLSCDPSPWAQASVDLTWTPSSGATGGYRAHAAFGNYFNTFTDIPSTTATLDSENFLGTVARFHVQAIAVGPPRQTADAPAVAVLVPSNLCGEGSEPPGVSTSAIAYSEPHRMLILASVGAELSPTVAHFEWGTSTSYGQSTPTFELGDGHAHQAFSLEISGLACATAYHYRVVASNSNGTSFGEDRLVVTEPCPDEIFLDGFETGDFSRWTGAVGDFSRP